MIHKVANLNTIHERLTKLISSFLEGAKENQTIQDVHDEYHLLMHKTFKPAHRSVLDQFNLLQDITLTRTPLTY